MAFGILEDKQPKNHQRDGQQSPLSSPWSSLPIRRNETALRTSSDPNNKSIIVTSTNAAVRNSFLAGWTAGVIGTLVGHPLDSFKVWMQTGIRPTVATSTGSGTILTTMRRFYAGVSGPVVTVGIIIQSINFAVYDTTRRFWYYKLEDNNNPTVDDDPKGYLNHDSYTSVGVAGFAAGAALSVITSPIILMIKTLQQTKPNLKFQDALRCI